MPLINGPYFTTTTRMASTSLGLYLLYYKHNRQKRLQLPRPQIFNMLVQHAVAIISALAYTALFNRFKNTAAGLTHMVAIVKPALILIGQKFYKGVCQVVF